MKKRDFAWLSAMSLMALAMLAAFGFSARVQADDPQNLEFKGVLIEPPPCSISDDGTLVVDFGGKVGIRKVSSGIYRENVPLTLTCDESSSAWQLLLTVTGKQAGFDADNATVVTPEQPDLGVKLYLGGAPFELGKPVQINGTTLPDLEAVLVQRDGTELQEGDFTALATLRAEYQ